VEPVKEYIIRFKYGEVREYSYYCAGLEGMGKLFDTDDINFATLFPSREIALELTQKWNSHYALQWYYPEIIEHTKIDDVVKDLKLL